MVGGWVDLLGRQEGNEEIAAPVAQGALLPYRLGGTLLSSRTREARERPRELGAPPVNGVAVVTPPATGVDIAG